MDTDPNFPPYGVGTGQSPLVVGEQAFETAPIDPIDVMTDPGYSRRLRRADRQEFGYSIDSVASYQPPVSAAAVEVTNVAGHVISAGTPTDVVPPDDAESAVPRVNQ